jgi:hypothetical protein
MKHLLLILFLFIYPLSKAQDGITFPVPVAKQIAKDLTSCDSLGLVNELTKAELKYTQQKSLYKDSIIFNFKSKSLLYEERLKNEQEKFKIQGVYTESLERQNKRLKITLTVLKIIIPTTGTAALAGILYLTLHK